MEILSEYISLESLGLRLGIFADSTQVVLTLAGLLTAFVAWRRYKRNQFWHRVSCTLQVIEGGDNPWLLLRSLYVGDVSEIITEPRTRHVFMGAVRECTQENPFVRVHGGKSRERILRSLISHLATYSGIEAKIAAYLGLDAIKSLTLVGVPTCEIFRDERDHHVRIWYIRPQDLSRFLNQAWTEKLSTEVPYHRDRVIWLRAMAEIYFNGTTDLIPSIMIQESKAMIHEVSW